MLFTRCRRSVFSSLLFFIVLSIQMPSSIAAEGYSRTVSIVEGQTTLLPYVGVSRVSIGHPDIANAQATGPDEILLTGLKAGVTDLRVWTAGGSQKRFLLRVVDNSWVQILEIANIVLADVEGVNAREENGIVFIEGRVLRQQDVTIIEDMKKKLSSEIGKGNVVFNVVKPTVNLAAMIMLDVQVVEVRRNDAKKIGIQWGSSAAGPLISLNDGIDSGKIGITTSLGSTIQLLQNEGVARVLAQPKLVTRSGSKAEFLAGGEIPIPVTNQDGSISVTFKQVGVILNMQPVADPDGFIATALEIEVSAVDESVSVLGIPGFTTRSTKMEMNVLSGQTMVVSGMLQSEDSKSITRLPGLGSIPIIGELFKSRDFQDQTTELMIFVTPHLMDPEGKLNTDLMQYGRELGNTAREDTKSWSIFD
ncbi:MAG: pilus assembly protein N-terminal domain-containing protein [Pseudomonadales bacterium]|nr:pilus assembly protein N-terminal domain-containing protein [Pseudomonadales bacterium]